MNAETTQPLNGLRILLVEDEIDAAETTARLLQMYGHDVRVAGDGPAALQAARDEVPDVVLLDLGLPGMDGYQVAQRLREQQAKKRLLVIAISGYGRDSDERLKSYQAGIDLHLTKPVEVQELQRFLERFRDVTRPTSS
jgi:two-component system CheB/CheR fusion protein